MLHQLGPGLIITASIVGSGELIVTTKLGAEVGFRLLWFIVFGCVIKVLVQIELGKYTIVHGKTSLDAMNEMPGPRWVVSWLVYVWLAMFVATFFQLSGIVGGIAGVFQRGGSTWSPLIWALLICLSCALLLGIGRYGLVERFATAMVAFFSAFTICAVGALYWTDYAIGWSDISAGFAFRLGKPGATTIESFTTAFGCFGVIGVGASELIYYPYWCLEKGYARFVGPNDGTQAWLGRARGWLQVLQLDAWTSMAIYTISTIAFYLLGAAVLHGKGLNVTDDNLVPNLSHIYSESFGVVGLWVFLLGAFTVLYSTMFIATASNGRLMVDMLRLFGDASPLSESRQSHRARLWCVVLPITYFLLYMLIEKPVTLVFVGALAQSVMLPLLSAAAIYLRSQTKEAELQSWWLTTMLLWTAAALMTIVGMYQLYAQIAG